MSPGKATAVGYSNIAFVKFWGKRDAALNLPYNDSLSMNLSGARTVTTVAFSATCAQDIVVINGREPSPEARERVVTHLDRVRRMAGIHTPARVVSQNNFPMAAGIASSASAFAALSLAATKAAGLDLDERELSILARLGSGSACRSVPGGFTWWLAGDSHETSFARQIAPPEHWALRDLIAIVSRAPKAVSSGAGHAAAETGPFFKARLATLPRRLTEVKEALLARDFPTFGQAIEEEAISLHVIAMTSRPPITYWLPATLRLIQAVQEWRAEGLEVYFTMDAGPNVHLICQAEDGAEVERRLAAIEGVQEVIVNEPAGKTHLLERD